MREPNRIVELHDGCRNALFEFTERNLELSVILPGHCEARARSSLGHYITPEHFEACLFPLRQGTFAHSFGDAEAYIELPRLAELIQAIEENGSEGYLALQPRPQEV